MAHVLYKKMYSAGEFYAILRDGLRSVKHLLRGRRRGLISGDFVERIMLAVTEVNGCEICSYAHTKMALAQGMSEQEIAAMLSGSGEQVPEEQLVTVLFAQHYADTRGRPSQEAWRRLEERYGNETALGILGAVRAIMIGNAHGIPFSALRSRLKGKPIGKSSLPYEVGMVLSVVPFLPAAVLHAIALDVSGAPVVRFA
ncbi:MAG: carboxymuconolactone decarboxylase family protein [Anaeromyxobacteraceae bacterium]